MELKQNERGATDAGCPYLALRCGQRADALAAHLQISVHGVSRGQHAPVKDAGHDDAFRMRTVEDHVLSLLDSPQSWAKLIACAAQGRIPGEPLAAIVELRQIAVGLHRPPST